MKISGSQQPNPTMTALCVTPYGPLFLGPPTGEITVKTFGPQPIKSVIFHMPALYIHVLSIIFYEFNETSLIIIVCLFVSDKPGPRFFEPAPGKVKDQYITP